MNSDQNVRPFQFGISTLLAVTAMYAVLFSVLRSLALPPVVFTETAVFLTAIALGQRLLFGGLRPILASAIIGICLCTGFFFLNRALGDNFGPTVAVWGWKDSDGGRSTAYFSLGDEYPINPTRGAINGFVFGIIQGSIDGFFFGILIAGMFSIVDELKIRLKLHEE